MKKESLTEVVYHSITEFNIEKNIKNQTDFFRVDFNNNFRGLIDIGTSIQEVPLLHPGYKPLIKWVGGKRKQIQTLKELMPRLYNRYYEPFAGGGALFFNLRPKNAWISDSNSELINFYKVVRDDPYTLMHQMEKHINSKEYYSKTREMDRDEDGFKFVAPVKKAARFLYLNKSGYGGLYRVNKNGQFNVPYGKYQDPKYYEKEHLLACSALLSNAEISNEDFWSIKEELLPGDFVYFDPPYIPLKSDSFVGYTKEGFDMQMHYRLKELCDYIDSIGAYFMLSNSYTVATIELYTSYYIHEIEAGRCINSNTSKRGKIKEVIVTNYETESNHTVLLKSTDQTETAGRV